jgi:hypothetical protein
MLVPVRLDWRPKIALEEQNLLADPRIEFSMWLDVDRTGDLSKLKRASTSSKWEWGAGKKGAIILVNNDDDDAKQAPDCGDAKVNSGDDVPDLQPLFLRILCNQVPPGWRAWIKADPAGKIRIFDKYAGDGREIVGPTAGDTHELSAQELTSCLSPGSLQLGMEAVAYPDASFDGVVKIVLRVSTSDELSFFEQTEVRAAPWMMVHHGLEATEVYVADMEDFNSDFRATLAGFVGAAGCALREIKPATEAKLLTPQDLIDLATLFHYKDGKTAADKDGMRYLLKKGTNENILRPACIKVLKKFHYDESLMTFDELASHCTTTLNGARWNRGQLLAYKGDGAVTNEDILAGAREGDIHIPGFYYVDNPIANELWFIARHMEPPWWLDFLFAEATDDGVTNAERLLKPGQKVEAPFSTDRWMQDCMEIGYSCVPGHRIDAVMRARRNRPLRQMPQSLLGPDFGFHAPVGTSGDNTFDSNGNLECTPPHGKYKWGRIYYGSGRPNEKFCDEIKQFLEKQEVQKPIPLETGWLSVGHVDEMLTFVPVPTAAKARGDFPYKLVIACPRRAYELLEKKENRENWRQGGMFVRDAKPIRYQGKEIRRKNIEEFLTDGLPELKLRASELKICNTRQAFYALDKARETLQKEMGLQDTDIIRAPMIFYPNARGEYDALTTGTVNMLVINNHCIIPKPFGPIIMGRDLFEKDLEDQLVALGLTVKWIDDWDEYHVGHGEVHCGTNTLRKPPVAPWWEFQK